MRQAVGLVLAVAVAAGAWVAALVPAGEKQARPGGGKPSAAPLVLGVYWAGADLAQKFRPSAVGWKEIDAALDDLAAHHVNAVWVTHQSASTTAEIARRAARRGVAVVAALGELAGEVPAIRNGDHATRIRQQLREWGDAPRPLAWGLGDEPRSAYMKEMAAYVGAWRKFAPGEPVTTVVMHNDLAAAAGVGFDALSCDVYPFFSKGNPNGFNIPAHTAWLQHSRRLVALSPRPWMMGQAFQEPKGPTDVDPMGNVVYLPGAAPQWRMPTPAEVRWQALAAVAVGAKGMFYFHYRTPFVPNPKAAPSKLPAAVKERTNSQSPVTLVYPDGRPTPQFDAMGEAFAWLARAAPTLAPLKALPVMAAEGWEAPGGAGGNVVSVLSHPETGQRYAMVVSGYDAPRDNLVRVVFGPHITGLKEVLNGKAVGIEAAGLFRGATRTLAPATAELLECAVDADNIPKVYADDLSTDKFKTDAAEVQNVKRHPDWSNILSAGDSGATADQAYVVYDVDKLLGPLPAGGARAVTYEGNGAPPEYRGAFWSTSADGKTYAKLSANEFGRPVPFTARYLKVGLSWRQAEAPHYGAMARFSVAQWKRAAAR
jgi:hypothetical protein